MEDYQIVDMYWSRNEAAITQSDRKYGRMLTSLSASLLSSLPDAEECVNDTYLAAWGNMPTDRPTYLGAYLAKITRRISVDRYRHMHRQKRGGLNSITAELSECIPDTETVQEAYNNERLSEAINRFVRELDEKKRIVFVRRYFCGEPVEMIAKETGMKSGTVKNLLFRTREALRDMLLREDLL